MVEQRAVLELPQCMQVGADAVLAHEQATPGDLQGAVLREQVGRIVPAHLVHVVAIGGLEIRNVCPVGGGLCLDLQLLDLALERSQFACDFLILAFAIGTTRQQEDNASKHGV